MAEGYWNHNEQSAGLDNVTFVEADLLGGMPMTMPAMGWGEVRREARRLLPGCRFRRHRLWRYSLTWDRPDDNGR
jgi:hypothetical protein